MSNCNSSGNTDAYAGGICGAYGAQYGLATIINCHSTGTINGQRSGGIGGEKMGNYGSVIVTNCHSLGQINGSGAGGICGGVSGGYGSARVTNCYSRGNITGQDSGGICGQYSGYDGSSIVTNSYSSGNITGQNSGGIFGSNSSAPQAQAINCYSANNSWNSSTANTNLTGTPVSPSTSGTVWAYYNNVSSTPYIFSDYLSVTSIVSGTADYTIDISGNNFGTVTSVLLNGQLTMVPFTILSTTLINVNVSTYTEITSVTVANAGNSVITQVSPPIHPICFIAGTPVQTDQGIIHIDKINPKIHTINNKQIVAITRTVTHEDTLVCIEPDALAPNVPSEKTTVSRCHAILFNGKMVRAKKLVSLISDRDKIYHVKYNGEILYNVLLKTHEHISVNNMIAETLDPNHMIAKLYLRNGVEIKGPILNAQLNV